MDTTKAEGEVSVRRIEADITSTDDKVTRYIAKIAPNKFKNYCIKNDDADFLWGFSFIDKKPRHFSIYMYAENGVTVEELFSTKLLDDRRKVGFSFEDKPIDLNQWNVMICQYENELPTEKINIYCEAESKRIIRTELKKKL